MGSFDIGQPVRRVEDFRLLVGQGRYTGDLSLEGQVYAYFLRSPHAHARIGGIQVANASAMPGVLAVYIGSDVVAAGLGDLPCEVEIKGPDGTIRARQLRRLLVREKVRYVGDNVALVIAETLTQARDAAEAIEVDYDPLPALGHSKDICNTGAPVLWPDYPGNVILHKERGDAKATAEAFVKARHVVSVDLVNSRLIPNYMEPRAVVADYDAAADRYTLYTPTQSANLIKTLLSKDTLKVPAEKIRVVTGDVGGGFGGKIYHYTEHVLCLWASKNLGRPVKWVAERSETFQCDTHARDNVTHAELALDEAGKFLGLKVQSVVNIGAYLNYSGPARNTYQDMISGCYAIPALHVGIDVACSNMTPVDAYRGAGRPEAAYVIERLTDMAAAELGLDAVDIRRRNFIRPDAMPFTTAAKQTYDVGTFGDCLEEALHLADWGSFASRRKKSKDLGLLRGIGLSTYIESAGGAKDEECTLRFSTDGRLELLIGTQASGQGHETSFAQIATQYLGIPFDSIQVIEGDTDLIPHGRGSMGSRSMAIGSEALLQAADATIEKGKAIAARLLQAPEDQVVFSNGRFRFGPSAGIDLLELAAIEPGGLDSRARFMPSHKTYPYGAHVCEVEIDPETGVVRVDRYTLVDDFGTVINPLLADGQLHGAVAQGIGQALWEETVYDRETGQLLTASFMDYAMPRAADLPLFEMEYHVTPATANRLGVKGVAESGTIGATPAVINAVVDALRPFGVRHIDMPATPEKVWRAIHGMEPKESFT